MLLDTEGNRGEPWCMVTDMVENLHWLLAGFGWLWFKKKMNNILSSFYLEAQVVYKGLHCLFPSSFLVVYRAIKYACNTFREGCSGAKEPSENVLYVVYS
jgi:hypothetical protein